MATLLYDLTDGVAVVTLNRPEVMNARSSDLRRQLLQGWPKLRPKPRPRRGFWC